jgi:hypothetical protein
LAQYRLDTILIGALIGVAIIVLNEIAHTTNVSVFPRLPSASEFICRPRAHS